MAKKHKHKSKRRVRQVPEVLTWKIHRPSSYYKTPSAPTVLSGLIPTRKEAKENAYKVGLNHPFGIRSFHTGPLSNGKAVPGGLSYIGSGVIKLTRT